VPQSGQFTLTVGLSGGNRLVLEDFTIASFPKTTCVYAV
jgi:hypothetical protein